MSKISSSDRILELDNISYNHENHGEEMPALDHISVSFLKNKRTFILGSNGAGKTLLLYICHGLLKPSAGKVILKKQEMRQAMVFAKPTLLRRSVFENIKFIMELHHSDKNSHQQILKILKEFDMEQYKDTPARHLSSGEQQRLAVLCAILLKPEILFLDEVSSNLDPHATLKMENMIKDCSKKSMTIIMACHDLNQAKRLADIIIYMEKGKIIEQTEAKEFFTKPKTKQGFNFINGILS